MYKARKWYGFSSLDIHGYNFLQKVRAPDGYPFFIVDLPQPVDSDPVVSVSIIAIKMSPKFQMFSGGDIRFLSYSIAHILGVTAWT